MIANKGFSLTHAMLVSARAVAAGERARDDAVEELADVDDD